MRRRVTAEIAVEPAAICMIERLVGGLGFGRSAVNAEKRELVGVGPRGAEQQGEPAQRHDL